MNDYKQNTIILFAENKTEVLYRIINIFLRRKITITNLHVTETEKKEIAKITITITQTQETVTKITQQLHKIIEVMTDEQTEQDAKNMLPKVSDLASSIEISAIKKMQLLATEDKAVISLAQGIPSFTTAPHIKEAAISAITQSITDKYTSGYGIDELRQAMVEKIKRDNAISASLAQVIVTHGAIEAVIATLLTIANPEDEIIILTPDYASHITQAQIAQHGRKPILVSLEETEKGWILDPQKIEAAMSPHTKALLFCNPCNPTGKVYTYEELQQIAQIAIKYNLYIISDEMYEYFTFDTKKHISIGSFPEVADRVISIFGVSKSYAMTGWRIGYIVANKELIPQIFKIHDSLVTCPAVVSQYAALAAITGKQEIVEEYRKTFEKRRDLTMKIFNKSTKIKLTSPEGSYFAFPKIMKPINDATVAIRLIHEAKVAVIPGSAFGTGGENHLRISFGGEEEQLKEGLKRLVNYIEKYV